MEGSNDNENKITQNERHEIFMNETKFEDDVMEEIEKNPTLHIKTITILRIDEKKNEIFEIIAFLKEIVEIT
jgi:hypothetical protein